MSAAYAIVAVLTIASAVCAMSLRNLVHCALSLVITFAGLAALFLQLNAQFVGFAQILVYVGAVAILIVFAILLTRSAEPGPPAPIANSPRVGLLIAGTAFATMAGAVISTALPVPSNSEPPAATVRQIGEKLLHDYVLPLEVIGLLLTAAMIGAVIIAMQEKSKS